MNRDKELYQQLRKLSWDQLWSGEVTRFNAALARERFEKVAIVRAVGVVFTESGNINDRDAVKTWLRNLLKDPDEKIRRYAAAAIPKIGSDADDERVLVELVRATTSEREKEHVAEALSKIGGEATLSQVPSLSVANEQRLKARIASGALNVRAPLNEIAGLKINLWGRAGLESIVRDEIAERFPQRFHIDAVSASLVSITPLKAFSLADLFTLRCFGFIGFKPISKTKDLAELITSPDTRRILETFTEGPIRYRLEFIDKGHQRAAVRELADRIYTLAPTLLNSGANAPWTIAIHPDNTIELRPRMAPDPRFAYRRRDVPAASHPPLAACMARLAGGSGNDIVWDPFCGSGLELIERALLGSVRKLIGADRNSEAIQITKDNLAAAGLQSTPTHLAVSDFRTFDPGPVDLIITNPPLGKRVPIHNLRGLFEDLFNIAAKTLRPGGRLVFANPLRLAPRDPSLKLAFAQVVDFGGFNCRLEKYVKRLTPPSPSGRGPR